MFRVQPLTDITVRSRAEETIKDRDEELVTIYENAPVIMLLVNAERRVRKVNKYAKQFAGVSDGELIGRRGGEALRCVHAPDDPRGCGFGRALPALPGAPHASWKLSQTVAAGTRSKRACRSPSAGKPRRSRSCCPPPDLTSGGNPRCWS